MKWKVIFILCGILLIIGGVYYVFVVPMDYCSIESVAERVVSLTEHYDYADRISIAQELVAKGWC